MAHLLESNKSGYLEAGLNLTASHHEQHSRHADQVFLDILSRLGT